VSGSPDRCTGEPYHPPQIPEDLSIERAYERRFGLIDEPVHTVRIRFSPKVAYFVKERRRHPTQRVVTQDDGSMVATI
jgi:hypothetical protein